MEELDSRKVGPELFCHIHDQRIHRRDVGDVVDKGGSEGGKPHDDHARREEIALGYLENLYRHPLDKTDLDHAADDHEKSHEEEYRGPFHFREDMVRFVGLRKEKKQSCPEQGNRCRLEMKHSVENED